MPKLREEIKDNIASEPDFTYGGYTYSDYLKFDMDYMVEVIRGKLFKMSPAPGSTHQEILGKLYVDIAVFLAKKDCKVFVAPYDVILPVKKIGFAKSQTVVQPDICVICDKSKIREKGCFGPPDWIIEIISPHTTKKDLQLKYDVYEESGVNEYWIVMPKSQVVEVYILENNRYLRLGAYAYEDTVAPVTLPGLEITLAEVFGEKPEY
jgi:Uma2 family endonuclease